MWKPLALSCAALLVAGAAGRAAESDDKLVRDLVAILKDQKAKPEVRSTAIRALGGLGWSGRAALPELLKLLDDPQERQLARQTVGPWETIGPWYYVIEALGQMGPGAKEAVPSLVKAKGAVPVFDTAIDNALKSIIQPPPEVFGLLAALRSPEPGVRLLAARALRSSSGDFAVVHPALLQAASSDPDADVQKVARESAQEVAHTEVVRLVQLLRDRDENVRLLTAKALGKMGSLAAGAEPALREAAAKDPDADVQAVAKSALRKIAGKD
jgi:HEAT repeat protein